MSRASRLALILLVGVLGVPLFAGVLTLFNLLSPFDLDVWGLAFVGVAAATTASLLSTRE